MATYDEVMQRIISKQAQPSVALQYNDPRRVDPSHPYPAKYWDGEDTTVGGTYPNPERGWQPRPYVPGTNPIPYDPAEKYWGDETDETALQYRGQVAGLTPEVRQSILNNATSEQQIENLIQLHGVPVVERVLREDIASGDFHSVSDTRSHSDDWANLQTLYNRRHGILGKTDWMR